MLLHEYLLAADKREDLADPARAAAWLKARPWGFAGGGEDLTDWTARLHALRALARRLRGKAAARPAVDDGQTPDSVLGGFLELFRLWPVAVSAGKGDEGGSPLWGGVKLSRRTLRGLEVFPTYQASDRLPGHRTIAVVESRANFPDSAVFWFNGGDLFWQLVFRSLLVGGGPAVCHGCGVLLGATKKTKKRSRRKLCKRCQYRKWYDDLPPEKKRERWNKDYDTYRRKGK
jgi:hypothetical protein